MKKASAGKGRPNAYARLARMQMDPTRVENIQRALISAGAMQGSPTGRWDSETHDAMSRYQAQNGFGVTGLPDAKSLMKLGLGPHPLPPQLDRAASAPAPNADRPLQSPANAPSSATSPSGTAVPGTVPDPPRQH